MRPGIPYRIHYNKARPGSAFYVAPNPDYGALISYYLKTKTAEKVKITITDAAGQVVRQLSGPADDGINRIAWDLRWTAPVAPAGGDSGAKKDSTAERFKVRLRFPGSTPLRFNPVRSSQRRKSRSKKIRGFKYRMPTGARSSMH